MAAKIPEKPVPAPEPRVKVRLAIYYGLTRHRLLTDYAVNVSSGGIYIETDNFLPVGTTLFVEFMLPASDMQIISRAKVAWTNEPGNLKSLVLPPGMGLQFIDLSLEDIRAIRDFLSRDDIAPVW